ncbi:MAG: adenine deaminase [Treponema sp.]|nr:adenine deaminase [Treponema sp.]
MKNLERLVSVASGRVPAETVYHGATILNVFTSEWEQKDIYVYDHYIAAVAEPGAYTAQKQVDVTGKWIVPGFIDAHVHIESSMVLPGEFARTIVKHGTTTVIADSHEIANVLGPDAVRFMVRQSEGVPADIYFMIPSCVPATDFEHTGGVISVADITSLLQMPRVLGLGEMMNYPGVIGGDRGTLDKLSAVFSVLGDDAVIDGHAPLVLGNALQGYRSVGIRTDHECHTFEEAKEKVKNGMYILVRQGSSARDLNTIIPGLARSNLPMNRFCFCTDDKNIADIISEGHIDSNIRNAIKLGLPSHIAYAMASLHTAECYHLPDTGALCAGYKADFVILDDKEEVKIQQIIKAGRPAKVDTPLAVDLPNDCGATEAEELLYRAAHSMHLEADQITPELFADSFDQKATKYAIALQPGSLNTKKAEVTEPDIESAIKAGTYCRLTVLERHQKTGCHATALLKGYGLQKGAIASSIGHDSHNVICAGIAPSDMSAAVKRLCTIGGGIVIVADAKILAELPLPVAGLMSNRVAEDVKAAHDALLPAARSLGIPEQVEPFVTLSFLALPVIPELRLTDQGLFDVGNWKFVK